MPPADQLGARRTRNAEWLRRQLRDIAATLGARDLDRLLTFAEFVKARRVARSYSQRHDAGDEGGQNADEPPASAASETLAAQKTLPS